LKSNSLPTRFGFLLVNNFTLISLSSAIEPLRMANRICGKEIYSWKTISETGEAVFASDGISINVDQSLDDDDFLQDIDAIFVCGGQRIEKNTNLKSITWLKKVNKMGIGLGAICTGAYVLAVGGLMEGFRCSIHWENFAALTDLFPNVNVNRSVFTLDRNRYTSSGGTAPVDMMLHFIGASCGKDISAGVADQFIYERIRQQDDEQRVPLKHFLGHQSERLVETVELMESNVSEPLSQRELASYIGITTRQLQRLFRRYLLSTPSRYYIQLRLKRARELLRQTNRSLVEISALTGFVSTSHFSKSYRKYYGHSPSMERQAIANSAS
jgi:transcriptional regulator GlxA family with amidase domain